MHIGMILTALTLTGCFSAVVNSPDGKSAFMEKCEQMKACLENAQARCRSRHLRTNPFRRNPGEFQVWTGRFEQKKDGFVWTYDLVEDSGTWEEPPSYTVVVKGDPDEKTAAGEQVLFAYCAD